MLPNSGASKTTEADNQSVVTTRTFPKALRLPATIKERTYKPVRKWRTKPQQVNQRAVTAYGKSILSIDS